MEDWRKQISQGLPRAACICAAQLLLWALAQAHAVHLAAQVRFSTQNDEFPPKTMNFPPKTMNFPPKTMNFPPKTMNFRSTIKGFAMKRWKDHTSIVRALPSNISSIFQSLGMAQFVGSRATRCFRVWKRWLHDVHHTKLAAQAAVNVLLKAFIMKSMFKRWAMYRESQKNYKCAITKQWIRRQNFWVLQCFAFWVRYPLNVYYECILNDGVCIMNVSGALPSPATAACGSRGEGDSQHFQRGGGSVR